MKPPDTSPQDPVDWQERHSPTKAVTLVAFEDGRAVQARCQRRRQDARIAEAIEDWGLSREASALADGARYFGEAVGYRVSRLEPRTGSTHADALAGKLDLIDHFRTWMRSAAQMEVDTGAVLALLVEGQSVRAVAQRHRRRRDWPMANLKAGLAVYRTTITLHPPKKTPSNKNEPSRQQDEERG